jgi:hypothetical protein
VASLVNVRPEDFLVDGKHSDVIKVPFDDDSDELTFTLIPQSLGEKTIRVRFEQDNCYLNTARSMTAVVEPQTAMPGDAKVDYPPAVAAVGPAPDFTILVEHLSAQTYTVSVRTRTDDSTQPPRKIDEITFEGNPSAFMKAIFDDLDAKTKTGLSKDDFDKEVAKIGYNLYQLFSGAGFKAFYWEQMYPRSELQIVRSGGAERYIPTVQIVSAEPYVAWELLRPFRRQADGAICRLALLLRALCSRALARAGRRLGNAPIAP